MKAAIDDVIFTATCDGSPQRYVRVLPATFDARGRHDVLVALHGHGSDRWQFVRDPRDECRAARDVAVEYGMLYVSPDYRAPASWMGPEAEADLVDIIAALHREYRVGRMFLCGGSMGGAATLTFAGLHPGLLDGIVAMNGIANHLDYGNFQEAISRSFGGTRADVPDEYRKRSAELHAVALRMPVGLTTSGQDSSTPPDSVLRLAQALRTTNPDVLLIHREERGHETGYDDARAALEFVLERAGPVSRPAADRG
jgi:pimeloyl-ACP methyl ester carboxylesterase